MIYQKMTDLIGHTPLVKLEKFSKANGLKTPIIAKLEGFNPSGSVKCRIAYAMITDAENKGELSKGSVIIEPSSGNTGIGLAFSAAVKGYRCIIVMPESMSIERRKIMKAYGAELVLTEAAKGMPGAIEKATALLSETPNSFMPSQFENPANPRAHYLTTGPEIWEETESKVDILIGGVGTGGTISGTGAFLKEKNNKVKVYAVEPAKSAVLSGGSKGPHAIQGIGAGFIPETYDKDVVDGIVQVKDEDAIATARSVAQEDGLLCGISSGAALSAAVEVAKRAENEGKNIVVIIPDGGERYLSTALFEA